MGRLIDETDLMNLLYALDDARHELCYVFKKIPELPEVEAIPKAEYEARLKADMVAMLEELHKEIMEMSTIDICSYAIDNCIDRIDVEILVKEKINKLKAESEE